MLMRGGEDKDNEKKKQDNAEDRIVKAKGKACERDALRVTAVVAPVSVENRFEVLYSDDHDDDDDEQNNSGKKCPIGVAHVAAKKDKVNLNQRQRAKRRRDKQNKVKDDKHFDNDEAIRDAAALDDLCSEDLVGVSTYNGDHNRRR